VLVSNLRRTLTPDGWVQEFDSRKVVLADTGRTILTREAGLTRFDRVPDQDFSAGEEYWQEMGPFWADVRGVWEEILGRGEPIQLAAERDGKRIWERVFALADSVQGEEGEFASSSLRDRIQVLIEEYRMADSAPASTR
jgi:hypothetical protein